MPCRDYQSDDDFRVRQNQKKTDTNTKLKARADELSAYLCFLCGGGDIKDNPELAEWWVEHQKQDAIALKRKETKAKNERDKTAALNKLSEREKNLLKIK